MERKPENEYGFCVPSMQSIWYGRQEKIFHSPEDREALTEYTKKAIDFAAAIGCGNLVFGCPRNRNIEGEYDPDVATDFFQNYRRLCSQQGNNNWYGGKPSNI